MTSTTIPKLIDGFILPKRVRVRLDAGNPSRSRLAAAGIFDTGSRPVNLGVPAALTLGGLEVRAPSLAPLGNAFVLREAGLEFRVRAARTRSSRAFFRMRLARDLTGQVDLDAPLTLRFRNSAVDGFGIVRLTNGGYRLARLPGTLIAPNLYLFRAEARVAGGGQDRLFLRAGLAAGGSVPATAPDLTIGFGESFRTTIPSAAFRRTGGRFTVAGGPGSPGVQLDFRREVMTVVARAVDLGAFVEGPQPVSVTVRLGDDERVNAVRMVRTGRRLRY